MTHNKKRFIIFFSSIIGLALCYLFPKASVCNEMPIFCNSILLQVRNILFIMSLSVFLSSCVLFFVRKETFFTWSYVAKYYFIFMLISLLYTMNNGVEKLRFTRFTDVELVVAIMLPVAFFGTIFLAIYKSWQLNKDM